MVTIKRIISGISAVAVAVFPFVSMSDQPDEVRIAKFKGDCAAAVSFTFDDNMRDQDDVAVPMLERYGFHGTFFVVAGVTPDTKEEAAKKKAGEHGSIGWDRLKELAAAGHEIANHSWTHANLPKSDDANLEQEVNRAYERITEKIGVAPLSFCYPGNGYDDRVRKLVMQRHVADRTFQDAYGGKDFTAELANKRIDDAILDGKWLVGMIHGITTGYEPFTSPEIFEGHLKYVKSLEAKVWVDTFANVSRYIQERDASKLAAVIVPGKAVFTLTCPLDPVRYNVPLTVVIPVKGKVSKAIARRSGAEKELPVRLCGEKLLVDAVPSEEPVTVTWIAEP